MALLDPLARAAKTPEMVLLIRMAVGSLVVALAGCAVGPDYVAPITALQPLHHVPAHNDDAARKAAPALDTWWTGFDDPMLVTIVERALAQNLDLAASFARVQQARAAVYRSLPVRAQVFWRSRRFYSARFAPRRSR